jgi:hypothetical protein
MIFSLVLSTKTQVERRRATGAFKVGERGLRPLQRAIGRREL